jgi:hypothetical protein
MEDSAVILTTSPDCRSRPVSVHPAAADTWNSSGELELDWAATWQTERIKTARQAIDTLNISHFLKQQT